MQVAALQVCVRVLLIYASHYCILPLMLVSIISVIGEKNRKLIQEGDTIQT